MRYPAGYPPNKSDMRPDIRSLEKTNYPAGYPTDRKSGVGLIVKIVRTHCGGCWAGKETVLYGAGVFSKWMVFSLKRGILLKHKTVAFFV
jgi:hypothetical protein